MKYLLLFLPLVFIGCSHSLMRGTVAMKVSNDVAHVCLDNSEVKEGDEVALFKNECTSKSIGPYSRGSGTTCKKVRLGKGFVFEKINEHYSAVKFDTGVKFDEGMFIEKL